MRAVEVNFTWYDISQSWQYSVSRFLPIKIWTDGVKSERDLIFGERHLEASHNFERLNTTHNTLCRLSNFPQAFHRLLNLLTRVFPLSPSYCPVLSIWTLDREVLLYTRYYGFSSFWQPCSPPLLTRGSSTDHTVEPVSDLDLFIQLGDEPRQTSYSVRLILCVTEIEFIAWIQTAQHSDVITSICWLGTFRRRLRMVGYAKHCEMKRISEEQFSHTKKYSLSE